MKIYSFLIALLFITLCVSYALANGPRIQVHRKLPSYLIPFRVISGFAVRALNTLYSFLHSLATSGAQSSAAALAQAKAQYKQLEDSVEKLATSTKASVKNNVEEIIDQYNMLQGNAYNAAEPFNVTMKLLLEKIETETETDTAITVGLIKSAIVQMEMDYASYISSNNSWMAKIRYWTLYPLEKIVAGTLKFFDVAYDKPELSAIAFLSVLAISAYISYKLGLLFLRVVVWLCIKMPIYVLKSIYNYIFGIEDEEFDLRENLLEETSDEVDSEEKEEGDASSDKKTVKTVYSSSEYLSSGLPRRALYAEDSPYFTSTKADKLVQLKEFDEKIELAVSDADSDKETKTKAAPTESSAISASLCSVSIIVAALAFLF